MEFDYYSNEPHINLSLCSSLAKAQAIAYLNPGNVTEITTVSTTLTKRIVHPSLVQAPNSNVPI